MATKPFSMHHFLFHHWAHKQVFILHPPPNTYRIYKGSFQVTENWKLLKVLRKATCNGCTTSTPWLHHDSLDRMNAHGWNGQLLNLMLLKTPPHPRPSPLERTLPGHNPSAPVTDGKGPWQSVDSARQQKDLTCLLLMNWKQSGKRSRESRMKLWWARKLGPKLWLPLQWGGPVSACLTYLGLRLLLKKMENHNEILLDTHYSGYYFF